MSSVVFSSLPPATPSSRSGGLDGGHNHSKVGYAHTFHHSIDTYTHAPTHTHVNQAAPPRPRADRRLTSDIGGELASHCTSNSIPNQMGTKTKSNRLDQVMSNAVISQANCEGQVNPKSRWLRMP